MLSRVRRGATVGLVMVLCGLSLPANALTPTECAKKWQDLQSDASHALDCNQYWQAEPLLFQALEESKQFGDSDLRHAKSLGEIGRLYTVRGKFDLAQTFLEEEYAVKVRARGKTDGKIIPDMASLIKFYLEHGTATKANPLTQEMLLFVENKIMDAVAPPEMSMKFKQGEALEAYAGVADSTLHPTMDWALACDDVGNAYKQRGDLAMADRLYKAGLDVKSNIVVKDHLALASSYDNIGAVTFKRNDAKEAESYLKDSLATTETKLTPDDPQVWARLNSYAKCLIKEKKYAEAEQLYIRAQDFWPADSMYDGARARAALELGCLYSDQHKYGQAAPLLRRALSLATECYGPLSCNLEPYRERYAHVCYYVGRRPHRTRHHAVTAHRRRHQQRGQVTARARGRIAPVG